MHRNRRQTPERQHPVILIKANGSNVAIEVDEGVRVDARRETSKRSGPPRRMAKAPLSDAASLAARKLCADADASP